MNNFCLKIFTWQILKNITMNNLILICLLLFCQVLFSTTFEPFTMIAIGTVGIASLVTTYMNKCRLLECCESPWHAPNMTDLQIQFRRRLYGQHLVQDTVLYMLSGHLANPSPRKALVFSFHGSTGAGKNYVSRMISENIFTEGTNSKFVHTFIAPVHFPHEAHVDRYKDQLSNWIRGNVTQCQHSVFIFDEIDKLPTGLLDVVKPYMDTHSNIDGVSYRKSIFILLSNTAGSAITRRVYKQFQDNRLREDLTLKEMEEIIRIAAFNEKGGLWHSDLIEDHVVSAFVPFLPLELRHIKLCIKDDLRAKGFNQYEIKESLVNQVANELQYFPEESMLFSKSGCKRVSEKVDFILEGMGWL